MVSHTTRVDVALKGREIAERGVSSFLPRELARLARYYGGEPYWPLTRSKEVVDAISRAGRAVTGIEQMRFEPGFTGPRVLRLAPLKLNRTLRWAELIEDARSQAAS